MRWRTRRLHARLRLRLRRGPWLRFPARLLRRSGTRLLVAWLRLLRRSRRLPLLRLRFPARLLRWTYACRRIILPRFAAAGHAIFIALNCRTLLAADFRSGSLSCLGRCSGGAGKTASGRRCRSLRGFGTAGYAAPAGDSRRVHKAALLRIVNNSRGRARFAGTATRTRIRPFVRRTFTSSRGSWFAGKAGSRRCAGSSWRRDTIVTGESTAAGPSVSVKSLWRIKHDATATNFAG